MQNVIITFKIMPASPEIDLDEIKEKAIQLISEFKGEVGKEEKEPIAFGIVALKLTFVMDESLGGTDELEEKIAAFEEVASCEVIDCRRAIG